jgi:C1A family cysteine protease
MGGERWIRVTVPHVGRLALFVLCGALLAAAALPAPAAAAPWTGSKYPARYDLRAHGRVTRVGLQDHYGTCWIFAALGSLESCLLPGSRLDLSENHMADFQGSRLRFEGRAPSTISTAYVARWEGPVLERDDPYPRPGRSREGLPAVRHVQEVLFLPRHSAPRANDAIKWAVMRYGAVDATMAYEASAFNAATSAYYSRGTDLDHHVCIVGWDDAYPAGRFLRRPPGSGAFLIKNSWGTSYGQGGYFWISYYDRAFGTTLTVFDGASSAADYDAIYQHDAFGWSRSVGFGSTTGWFAARYTSGGDGSVTAASFYTAKPGASYEVRVAPSLAEIAAAPVAGSGTLGAGGYHTVSLAAPAPVTTGADFVVAVRLTTPGTRAPIPVEHPTGLLTPRPAAGRSFISRDGVAWKDLRTKSGFGSSDVCLKAFVDAAAGGDDAPPRVVLEPATARPGSGSRVHFTLTDPAFSAGSAVIKLMVRDAQGRTLRKLRIPAVAVNERDAWRFAAPRRPGDYVVLARAWDVAGHRSDLTRAVLQVR